MSKLHFVAECCAVRIALSPGLLQPVLGDALLSSLMQSRGPGISDQLGRKKALVVGMMINGVFAMGSVTLPRPECTLNPRLSLLHSKSCISE